MDKYLNVPPVPEDAEIAFETDFKNLYELFAQGENLETITLAREIDGTVYERTFDALWYNDYGTAMFCVLGADEEDGYLKYVYRIVEFEDGTTGLYFEEDEDVLKVVRADFDAALTAYQNNNVAAPAENIQSKSKNNGGALTVVGGGLDKKVFAVLTVLYGLVLGAGLIGYFTGFGIGGEQERAVCRAVCLAYALVTPSYLVYIGAHNPFNAHRAVAVILMVIGCLAMAGCAFLGLVLVSRLGEPVMLDGVWAFFMHIFIPALPFVAAVVYALAYIWWCRRLAPGWFLGFGIGVTLLFPVAAALVFAVFIIFMIILLIRWMLFAFGVIAEDSAFGNGFIAGLTGKKMGREYTVTDEHGYTHTVHSYNGRDFYGSDGRYAGSSSDGGKTINLE